MADVNPTAASLLGFLHAGEASGYELVDLAEAFIGDFWTLTRSQVYRELAALAERGLVEAGPVGPRARRPYRLTDAGRTAFAAWLAEPPGPEQIRYPLLLTLAFGSALDRDRLVEFIADHRAVHEKRLAGYLARRTEGFPDRYQEATCAFGIRYERAVLAWIDDLPAILGDGDV
ncbi:PadR family transcriptional regulator [Streptomyces sp. SBT349]|uniref:PadR family transcriptional regulator n=1 Tax=Streptomyces sp. SBT349 TaxID=1580539 RepID=UPI00066CBB3A|nr:helix-turn-helix transcriptional regulator [Streptomyces sp. SBT349]